MWNCRFECMADTKRGGMGGSGQLSMGTVPLRPAQGQDPTMATEEVLPVRPSLVAERNKNAVQLHANYFPLSADKKIEVSKYTFRILGGRQQKEEIRGESARQIFKLALPALQISQNEYATDYKQQLVTLSPITLPEGEREVTVEGCVVQFDNPVQVHLDTSVSGPPSQDVIDCLNLIISQSGRKRTTSMATIGRRRFFPRSGEAFRKGHLGDVFEIPIPEMLSVSRGFFLGVRPAENQLFLNVNTTFGVFRPHGQIKDLYGLLKERHGLVRYPERKIGVLSKLHQAISRARVYYTPPTAAKVKADDNPPKTVPIAGFARNTDKGLDESHPLEFDNDFPGPEQVRFWFEEGTRGALRTVKYHFQQSEFE